MRPTVTFDAALMARLRPADCVCPEWPWEHAELCPVIIRRRLYSIHERLHPRQSEKPEGQTMVTRDGDDTMLRAFMEHLHEDSVKKDAEWRQRNKPEGSTWIVVAMEYAPLNRDRQRVDKIMGRRVPSVQ